MGVLPLEIELRTIHQGFDGKFCWVNPWAGVCPDGRTGVLTVQRLDLAGSDVFFGACQSRTDDRGQTWSPFEPVPTMRREAVGEGLESCVNDLKPQWNTAGGVMLGIGVRVYYRPDAGTPDHVSPGGRSPQTVYSIWDPHRSAWSAPHDLAFRDVMRPEETVAGSVQRLEEPDGHILLPLSCRGRDEAARATVVARCAWRDGRLEVVETGNPMSVPIERGLLEPSLAESAGRYLLTMRNDVAAYVTAGCDGLHFDQPHRWRFDDGELLGSYNTQQHWVTHESRAWLLYTRRGLNNDHVFRHRAPLLIGEVDLERLVVIRQTETILIPERGARLGNFGVTIVDDQETWITAAEWMQPVGCERYGSDNSIYIAVLRF